MASGLASVFHDEGGKQSSLSMSFGAKAGGRIFFCCAMIFYFYLKAEEIHFDNIFGFLGLMV